MSNINESMPLSESGSDQGGDQELISTPEKMAKDMEKVELVELYGNNVRVNAILEITNIAGVIAGESAVNDDDYELAA